MAISNRFDLEALKEQGRLEKQAAMRRKIISNAVLVIMLIGLAIGGKCGWDWWQEKQERDRLEAERQEEAARRRDEQARIKAQELKAKRDAERQRKQEEKEAKRREEREAREKRRAEERERLEQIRTERELAKRKADADKEAQRELKQYSEDLIEAIDFNLNAHVAVEKSCRDYVDIDSDDVKWNELVSAKASRNFLVLYDMVNPNPTGGVKDSGRYPEQAQLTEARQKLNNMKFRLTVTLTDAAERPSERMQLYELTLADGLVEPADDCTVRSGEALVGWSLPFRFGDRRPYYFMTVRKHHRLQKEWMSRIKQTLKDARRRGLDVAATQAEKERTLEGFARMVKIQLETPEPPEVEPKKPEKPKSKLEREEEERRKRFGGNGRGYRSSGNWP